MLTIAIEVKCSKAPQLTKNNFNAIETVKPNHSFVLSLVEETYDLSEKITVTNISDLIKRLKVLENS